MNKSNASDSKNSPKSDKLSDKESEKEAKKNDALTRKTEILTKVLKYGTSLERKAGLMEIEKLPKEFSDTLKPLIMESLEKEKEATMRSAFIRVLGSLEIAEGNEEIYKALGEENEDLARQAVASLKKINPENGWEKVLARLKTEDLTKNSNLTVSLVEALAELKGGEGAADFLESKLKENFNSPEIRSQIALYMGKKKIKNSEITLQKIAFNKDESLSLRNYSINSLGKIDSKSSIPKLRELIDELRNQPTGSDSRKNQLLKIYSLGALVDLGAEGVFEEIVEFTRDDDSFVRFRAIQFLAETKREEAKEILEYKSMRDPSPKIIKYAKDTLEKWDEETPKVDEKMEEDAKAVD
ncbi:MAG: HEAT repeat domain-containing protein [Leptospira sp.]|nr:HEAT repeat domain-containing protein [Leptospira sp.]